MITFNPLDVIKSADLNANFAEVTDLIATINKKNIIEWSINNGTGTRSTPSGSLADIAGSSYVYTPDVDVIVLVIMSNMIIANSGVTRNYINVAGTDLSGGTYFDAPHWQIQTLSNVIEIDAGVATTIKARWSTSGSASITNASGDTSYPNYFRLVVLPK